MFSRLVPASQGRSFYDDLRRENGDDGDDVESRAGLLDEENLNHHFQDHDLEHADGLGVEDSRTTLGGVTTSPSRGRSAPASRQPRDARSGWGQHEDDIDNDVPASLLVERHEGDTEELLGQSRQSGRSRGGNQAPAIPGPSTARPQWEATQARQRLHTDDGFGPSGRGNGLPNSLFAGMVSGSAKKKAEWRWANVSNLDNFVKDVYDYYLGSGMWCILVERGLHLL